MESRIKQEDGSTPGFPGSQPNEQPNPLILQESPRLSIPEPSPILTFMSCDDSELIIPPIADGPSEASGSIQGEGSSSYSDQPSRRIQLDKYLLLIEERIKNCSEIKDILAEREHHKEKIEALEKEIALNESYLETETQTKKTLAFYDEMFEVMPPPEMENKDSLYELWNMLQNSAVHNPLLRLMAYHTAVEYEAGKGDNFNILKQKLLTCDEKVVRSKIEKLKDTLMESQRIIDELFEKQKEIIATINQSVEDQRLNEEKKEKLAQEEREKEERAKEAEELLKQMQNNVSGGYSHSTAVEVDDQPLSVAESEEPSPIKAEESDETEALVKTFRLRDREGRQRLRAERRARRANGERVELPWIDELDNSTEDDDAQEDGSINTTAPSNETNAEQAHGSRDSGPGRSNRVPSKRPSESHANEVLPQKRATTLSEYRRSTQYAKKVDAKRASTSNIARDPRRSSNGDPRRG